MASWYNMDVFERADAVSKAYNVMIEAVKDMYCEDQLTLDEVRAMTKLLGKVSAQASFNAKEAEEEVN